MHAIERSNPWRVQGLRQIEHIQLPRYNHLLRVTSQKHQAWDPPSRSAHNRSAETKHRRFDPAFKPPAPPSGSGGGAAGALLAAASSAFWADQIRQPRDFTQA